MSFTNLSVDSNYLIDFSWQFSIDGKDTIVKDWHPTITFPRGGQYTGMLTVAAGQECTDTVFIDVYVTDTMRTAFEATYDTCIAGTVAFQNQSFSDGGGIASQYWSFGDGRHSTR